MINRSLVQRSYRAERIADQVQFVLNNQGRRLPPNRAKPKEFTGPWFPRHHRKLVDGSNDHGWRIGVELRVDAGEGNPFVKIATDVGTLGHQFRTDDGLAGVCEASAAPRAAGNWQGRRRFIAGLRAAYD